MQRSAQLEYVPRIIRIDPPLTAKMLAFVYFAPILKQNGHYITYLSILA